MIRVSGYCTTKGSVMLNLRFFEETQPSSWQVTRTTRLRLSGSGIRTTESHQRQKSCRIREQKLIDRPQITGKRLHKLLLPLETQRLGTKTIAMS